MNGDATRNVVAAAAPTETESILLQIWLEVLNIADIDLHDDFLSIGGDSLGAMRCINRINAAFGVELSLELFLLDSACISQIAAEIARIQVGTGEVSDVAVDGSIEP